MAERYDPKKRTLWISSEVDGDTLIDPETLRGWSTMLRSGETSEGKSLDALNVVFSNREGAEYNHQALAFSKLGAYVGTLKKPEPYTDDEPEFEPREDFGIDS